MDITLAINPGSSSKKYALFKEGVEVLSVRFERTSDGFGKCVSINRTQQRCETMAGVAFDRGLYEFLDIAQANQVIGTVNDITHVGIRIVAPHTFFQEHRTLDDHAVSLLTSLTIAAPLHIPYILEEVRAIQEALPHAHCRGASDSAFHSTIPSHVSLYSIPEKDRSEYHIARYGYHGLSVSSVVRSIAPFAGVLPKRMIVVHLGSGVSVTAVRDGKSIDTTMGFTPASGLIMGTRGGDIDSAALLYVQRMKGFSIDATEAYLSGETGLKGLSGTSDLRIVIDRARKGDQRAELALEAFYYHIAKALYAYVGVLGGLDALVLTATAAERNALVRKKMVSLVAQFGAVLDEEENEHAEGRAARLTTSNSPLAVFVVPTDEMGEIARVAEAK